jgi:hypothetical protein
MRQSTVDRTDFKEKASSNTLTPGGEDRLEKLEDWGTPIMYSAGIDMGLKP